jgi:hypothetical protein
VHTCAHTLDASTWMHLHAQSGSCTGMYTHASARTTHTHGHTHTDAREQVLAHPVEVRRGVHEKQGCARKACHTTHPS